MKNLKFRALRANEIEARIGTITEKGCSLLLYQDARAAMTVLDETVGPMNWQRAHTRDNQNCTISIWDDEKNQWISKEDTGVESFSEKEKGLASDSFKRSAVNWGIGRELYDTPFIWIPAESLSKLWQEGTKWKTKDCFMISGFECDENKHPVYIEIWNRVTRKQVYKYDKRGK